MTPTTIDDDTDTFFSIAFSMAAESDPSFLTAQERMEAQAAFKESWGETAKALAARWDVGSDVL